MKAISFIIIFTFCSVGIYSQERVFNKKEFIGIWKGIEMTKEPYPNVKSRYYIFNKNELIKFNINNNWFHNKYYGFSNDFLYQEKFDEKYKNNGLKALKETGKYYYELDVKTQSELGHSIYTTLEDNILELFYVKYEKINYIPKSLLKRLLTQEAKDKENYIFDFLDLDIRKIIIPEAKLYNEKREELNKTLPKNEIVEILAIGEAWIKVNYYIDDKNKKSAYIKYSSISPKKPIPSFDPSKATTKIEKAICSDVVLASLDRQMLQAYKAAKKENPEKIKSEQKAWLKKRNSECKTKSEIELIQCLKYLYRKRLEELK